MGLYRKTLAEYRYIRRLHAFKIGETFYTVSRPACCCEMHELRQITFIEGDILPVRRTVTYNLSKSMDLCQKSVQRSVAPMCQE